jgi:1,4-dihydroxy-6-naphthoate synthase
VTGKLPLSPGALYIAPMHLRLAFSPDSDDLFMFYPLLAGKIDPGPYTFEHVRADTESLNRAAREGALDVVAISIASYPSVAEKYLLLPHGGSVGRGYGPMVVSRGPMAAGDLTGKKIGVPGPGTTAYLVLRLLVPAFEPVVLPISPFSRAFEAVRSGEVDAALLIHEGRLTYAEAGLSAVLDLGEAWAKRTGGLPLPLGGNAIRRGLGEQVVRDVSARLRESIRWSLEHREELIDALLADESRPDVVMTRALLDRYLAMYANEDTLSYPPDARLACERLMTDGAEAGLLPPSAHIEWSP